MNKAGEGTVPQKQTTLRTYSAKRRSRIISRKPLSRKGGSVFFFDLFGEAFVQSVFYQAVDRSLF